MDKMLMQSEHLWPGTTKETAKVYTKWWISNKEQRHLENGGGVALNYLEF